ncbi:hypothetical protein [Lewinella sp. JB7]|uniref:hypothetical protein n=1 Tax=Lewinella sp. JB7 TaxID=2962887 RepID=UPI0020C980AD|nr:hypothetical protein [Lewinella sp. JB7]MCP9234533.1 hypothetical protein [Lewinella sp. JB7]
MKSLRTLFLLPVMLLFTACLDDELAFTVVASPVNADIERVADAPDGTVAYRATFTELDKTGILDVNVGIIATPVVDLELRIFSQTQDLLETLTTDASGQTLFSVPAASLTGVTRLEWSGTYDGAAFRIITNL